MYRAADSAHQWKANIYFITLIFFLAWMVKNVFIAVITETFNEMRVQFQEMWVDRETSIQMEGKTQVLEGDNKAWKLVTVRENRHRGWAPQFCSRLVSLLTARCATSVLTDPFFEFWNEKYPAGT